MLKQIFMLLVVGLVLWRLQTQIVKLNILLIIILIKMDRLFVIFFIRILIVLRFKIIALKFI